MSTLAETLAALPDDPAAVPLVELDAGARVSLDREARWIHVTSDGVTTPFSPATATTFCEALERPRDEFEQDLAGKARALGLPDAEVVAAFPAMELIRVVLTKHYAHMTRLALLWLRPSELRDARAEILEITKAPQMPGPVKELARRLTVPDGQD